EGGNLRRRIGLALGLYPGVAVTGARDLVGNELLVLFHHRVVIATADEPFDGENGALGIGDRLAVCRLADQTLALVCESDDGRLGAHPFCILDDLRRLAFHDGDAGIRGPEIDTDDLGHGVYFLSSAADRAGPKGTLKSDPLISLQPVLNG